MQTTTISQLGVSCPSWCTNHDADDDGGIFHEANYGTDPDTRVTIATSQQGDELLMPQPSAGSIPSAKVPALVANLARANGELMRGLVPIEHASWCDGQCNNGDAPIMMDIQSHAPEADPVGFQAALMRFREKMIADGNEVFETWVPRGHGSGLQHLMRGCEFEIFMDAYESSVNTFFDVIQNGCRK